MRISNTLHLHVLTPNLPGSSHNRPHGQAQLLSEATISRALAGEGFPALGTMRAGCRKDVNFRSFVCLHNPVNPRRHLRPRPTSPQVRDGNKGSAAHHPICMRGGHTGKHDAGRSLARTGGRAGAAPQGREQVRGHAGRLQLRPRARPGTRKSRACHGCACVCHCTRMRLLPHGEF